MILAEAPHWKALEEEPMVILPEGEPMVTLPVVEPMVILPAGELTVILPAAELMVTLPVVACRKRLMVEPRAWPESRTRQVGAQSCPMLAQGETTLGEPLTGQQLPELKVWVVN